MGPSMNEATGHPVHRIYFPSCVESLNLTVARNPVDKEEAQLEGIDLETRKIPNFWIKCDQKTNSREISSDHTVNTS